MKKNKSMRIASALLVAGLLSTCVISGTFAKYTTTGSGSDTARVAKWDIDFAGNDSDSKNFVFNLFDTVKDSNGGEEIDVDTDDTTTIIAPGTSGSFAIVLTNASEVTAQYAIDYTVTNTSSIPVEFAVVTGTNATTPTDSDWKDSIDDIAASDSTKLTMGNQNNSATITVYWRWVFERYTKTSDATLQSDKTYYTKSESGEYTKVENPTNENIGNYYEIQDSADTALGEAATAPTITVSAAVTVTQVD